MDDQQPCSSSSISATHKEEEDTPSSSSSLLLSHFHLIHPPLGLGAFGCVFKAEQMVFEDNKVNIFYLEKHKDQGKDEQMEINLALESTFALKLIPEGSLSEVAQMSKICHSNIVQCHNVWVEDPDEDEKSGEEIENLLESIHLLLNPDQDSCDSRFGSYFKKARAATTMYRIPPLLILQMEYCDQGTLDDWIISRETTMPNAAQIRKKSCQIFSQLVQALVYLQLKGLVHGDLKLDNILLKQCPESGGGLVAKLGDFGLALPSRHKIVATKGNSGGDGEEEEDKKSEKEIMSWIENRRRFLPPEKARLELIQNSGEIVTGSSHKMDIYSLGLIWLSCLSSFKTKKEIWAAVGDAMEMEEPKKLPPSLLRTCSAEEEAMLRGMISWDPTQRPSATELEQFLQVNDDHYRILGEGDPLDKREEIEKMLDFYEKLADAEEEELDPELVPVFRKKYRILLLQIIEAIVAHIHPQDELFARGVECLYRFDNVGFQFEGGDAMYWFGKLVKKIDSVLGPDFESINVIKVKVILASTKAFSGETHKEKGEGLEELEKLVETCTLKSLPLLDPLRLKVQVIVWNAKYCSGLDNNDPAAPEEELLSTLPKVEQVYEALANKAVEDGLRLQVDVGVLNVIIHILTKLGREEEAEAKLKALIANPEEDANSNLSIISMYAKLLSHFKRPKEALALEEGVYERHLANGDRVEALQMLDSLAGYAYEVEQEEDFRPEEESTSRFNYYMMQATLLRNDVQKSGALLLNGHQLNLGDTSGIKSRSVDFVVIDNS